MNTLTLPDLGEGLTEAEIVRWLVAEGEDVRVDQPVVEVETAKTVVEVPTPFAGRVVGLHGREGETLPVGAPLISVEPAAAPKPAAAPAVAESGGSGSVLVGSGTEATVTVGRRLRPRTAAAAKHPTPVGARQTARGNGGRRTSLTASGKAAAANFARSRAEIPEATIWVDVDATALVELREAGRSPQDPGPGLLAYLAGFVVAALREYPVFNGRFDASRQELIETSAINLGIATQGERGLVVPVIRGAESMSVSTLDRAIGDSVARARAGRLTAAELADGTFTLNNYGGLGVDGSAAIINHPQVAILGIGRLLDRPWVVDGEIVVRKVAQLSFVFDHRICDGGTAAGFVRAVADAIEHPVRALARR